MKRKKKGEYTYEDFSDIIDAAVKRQRFKWRLDAVKWFDFEDVQQIIKLHIAKKWHMWDQERPLEPWIGRIISNQLRNLIRNHYGNYVNPCPDQHLSDHDPLTCPICTKWRQSKKSAYDIKLAVTMENHIHEIHSRRDESIDLDEATIRLTAKIKTQLNGRQFEAFKMLFVENKSEEEVARYLGFKTSEKKRSAGYKQIKNLKKIFQEKAKKIIEENDIV